MSCKYEDDQEVSKYIKKRESNISKIKKKSNHKHIYKPCLITYKNRYFKNPNNSILFKGDYCIVCGKIYDTHCLLDDSGLSGTLEDKEILEKNKKLPFFKDIDIWSKYVPLTSCE